MSILPITNIINVTVTNTPIGLTTRNVNALGLFTNEAPLAGSLYGVYGTYVSAQQVASDFGSNSKTAAMANAIFSQNPNILSGGGYLVIMPLIAAVSATPGNNVTPNVSANLAALIAVTNGSIRVTLSGTQYNLSGLDFTGATTLADIASIIQGPLAGVATVTANSTTITITNNKVGSTASVALASYTSGGSTDLSGSGYLNTGSAVVTAGVNSSGETLGAAIARTAGVVSYTGVISNLDLEDAAITTLAAIIQSGDYLYFQHAGSTKDIAGIGTTIQQATETKTRILLYSTGQSDANLMKAAYAGRFFSVDFTGSDTDITMNLKTLAGVVPDPNITQTLYQQASAAGVNLYVSYQGVPGVFSTEANDFDDNEYANLALKFYLEAAGFNYLAQTNTKVPQTEQGMYGLKNAYAQVMEQFVRNGVSAPGAWDSSETFGDPATFINNILNAGYYIYSLPIVLQNSSDRNARKAPLVQIAMKRAGAIHTSAVMVLVNA